MTDPPAGRELDAAVAKVLGKHVHWKHGHPFSDEIGLMGFNTIARYSTDHAAAIEALEAWRSKSPEHTWAIHRHPIGFTVELDCIIATLRKSAPTLAHAAALALVTASAATP